MLGIRAGDRAPTKIRAGDGGVEVLSGRSTFGLDVTAGSPAELEAKHSTLKFDPVWL